MTDTGLFILAADWRRIREDPSFVELVRLMRIVNQLSLSYPPLLATLEDQSPRARRERASAIVFAAALLQEGMRTAEGLAQYFRGLAQYREEFAPLFSDPKVQAYRANVLGRVRDELVFHVDRATIAEGLARFPAGDVHVASTLESDWSQGQIYFEIADDALFGALFGNAESAERYTDQLRELVEGTTELFTRFTTAAHRLIPAVLAQLGCVSRPIVRPVPPV